MFLQKEIGFPEFLFSDRVLLYQFADNLFICERMYLLIYKNEASDFFYQF